MSMFKKDESRLLTENAQEIWLFIKSALKVILESTPLSVGQLNFIELFSKTHKLVLCKYGHLLYEGLKNLLDDHLESTILGELLTTPVAIEFVENAINVWRNFEYRGVLIRDIFMHVECSYICGTSLDDIQTLVRNAFVNKIIHDPDVRRRVIDSASAVNKKIVEIKDILPSFQKNFEMLINLGDAILEDIFETPFLTKCQEYFANESKNLMEGKYIFEYIQHGEELYKQLLESLIVSQSRLDEVTISSVIQIFLDEVITKPFQTIGGEVIQNGGEVIQICSDEAEAIQRFAGEVIKIFSAEVIQKFDGEVIQILENKTSSKIESLYKFCTRIPMALKKLKEGVQNYLFAKYRNKVFPDKSFVQSRLDIRKEIEDSLISNEISKNIVDGCGFDYFLNSDQNAPEYFSAYIDKKLQENQEITPDVLKLLLFLNGNKFEHYYKRDLTKRLLSKIIPVDTEEKIITDLRNVANLDFSFKIDQMLNDARISESIQKDFEEQAHNNSGMQLNVQLLTSNIWPISSIVNKCTLPMGPRDAFESFSTFYRKKFNGRHLTLLPQLGRVDLNFYTLTQKYTIQVSTYQMMILDLFNEKIEINFEIIRKQTNIPRPNLIRALQDLSNGPASKKILRRNDENPNVFFINENYHSKNFKIKVRDAGGAEYNENIERKRIEKTVEDGRNQEIDATIVKIMKRKRILAHSDLLVEVTQELTKRRFNPQPQVFKKSVEKLIERNYLTRSAGDRKVYEYVQ